MVTTTVIAVSDPVLRASEILATLLPESLLDAFDAGEVIVTITEGPQHRMVWRNRLAVEVFGPMESGRPLFQQAPESADVAPLWDRAYAGESVVLPRRRVMFPDVTGRRRVMRYSMSPLRGRDGAPLGVIQLATDATVEADAERQAVRSRLLADVSGAVSEAADAAGALRALADALVREAADLAAVYVFPVARGLATSGEAVPPAVMTIGDTLRHAGFPPATGDRDAPSRWRSALAAGNPLIIPIDDDVLAGLGSHLTASWLVEVQASSFAIVPLVLAGEIAGAVLLMSAGSRPAYGDADLDLLEEVTSRAGAAISEARARERTRRIAQSLQSALLPGAPPQPPGLQVAARYVPGGQDNPVGGDWWDVVDLGDGYVGIGVGDISGHGIGAAALMGQARVAMRAASHAHLSPAVLLEVLDKQLAEAIEQEWDDDLIDAHRFATALYALVDPRAQCLRIASAGHLPLITRPATGAAQVVWTPGRPPLGLSMGDYQEIVVPFGVHDTAVLYTDGLVEDRDIGVSEGIQRLVTALNGAPDDIPVDALADLILAEMRRPAGADDDVALVVARRTA